MGVRGLSTFVDNNQQLLSDHKLHDTRVIIDGNNLYYFIFYHYKVSHQYGGDYDHYSRKCKHFFNILKSCNITPYIVFDGGYDPDDRKLPTILTRALKRRKNVALLCATGRGNVLPVITFETFRQVLVELGIPHVSCQFEADREIAVLAKEWKCPVLTNDSDFFVYNLEGGFLPLDYINLTLCVCDKQTGAESVMDFKKSRTENQFVYIPVKLYLCERFVKHYHKEIESSVLPMFASLLGNDFVDATELSEFYSRVCVPKNPNKKFCVPKSHTKMVTVLHWLDSQSNLEESLEKVVACTPKEKRVGVREMLSKSIEEYKNLERYSAINLKEFFDGREGDNSKMTDHSPERRYLELSDYDQNQVPSWFTEGLRKCEIASFLQNVSVLHRVIFLCQVELLKEVSTYSCSKGVRGVIYGIIIESANAENNTKESRDTHVVEYDRDVKNTKKFYIMPKRELPGLSPLPSIQTVDTLNKNSRMEILLTTLYCSEEHLLKLTGTPEPSKLLLGVLCHWIMNARPKVTKNHLKSILVCVILLHLRTLKWLDQKLSLGGSPVRPFLHEDIVQAYYGSNRKHIAQMEKMTEKHFCKLEHSAKHPRENLTVHGLSQFQACLFDTIHLNQLLMYPFQPPSPSLIFNGTWVFNMCRDLGARVNPDLYMEEVLGNGSPLYGVFFAFYTIVTDVCSPDCFAETESCSSWKTSKAKPKKGRRGEKSKEDCINKSSENEDVEKKQKSVISVNCDVNNRFALLDMDD